MKNLLLALTTLLSLTAMSEIEQIQVNDVYNSIALSGHDDKEIHFSFDNDTASVQCDKYSITIEYIGTIDDYDAALNSHNRVQITSTLAIDGNCELIK